MDRPDRPVSTVAVMVAGCAGATLQALTTTNEQA